MMFDGQHVSPIKQKPFVFYNLCVNRIFQILPKLHEHRCVRNCGIDSRFFFQNHFPKVCAHTSAIFGFFSRYPCQFSPSRLFLRSIPFTNSVVQGEVPPCVHLFRKRQCRGKPFRHYSLICVRPHDSSPPPLCLNPSRLFPRHHLFHLILCRRLYLAFMRNSAPMFRPCRDTIEAAVNRMYDACVALLLQRE